jgi:hypothetical protein
MPSGCRQPCPLDIIAGTGPAATASASDPLDARLCFRLAHDPIALGGEPLLSVSDLHVERDDSVFRPAN